MSIENVDYLPGEEPEEDQVLEADEAETEDAEESQSGTTEVETESEEEAEEAGLPAPKPKKGAEARIAQIIKEREDARRELAELKEQYAKQGDTAQAKAEQSSEAPKRPDIADYPDDKIEQYFADMQQFESDMADYRVAQAMQKRDAEAQAKAQAEQAQAAAAKVTAELQKTLNERPELKETLKKGIEREADHPIPVDLVSLGLPPAELSDLVLEIAGNEDLHLEIASMTTAQALMRLGSLRNEISARKVRDSQAPRVSKAPPPPNHTKSSTPAKRDAYKLSDDDFLASRGL